MVEESDQKETPTAGEEGMATMTRTMSSLSFGDPEKVERLAESLMDCQKSEISLLKDMT